MSDVGEPPTHVRTFGKYRAIAVLGHGGMADVYLATATGPGGFTKLVVVKELRAELADDPEFRTMFLDEARLAARLAHPNVVQTYEVLEQGRTHAIVMEYLDGQPMSRLRLRATALGELGVAAQLRVLSDSLAGLHAAHELTDFDGTPLHVVHRDVSPHNVFVSYAGEVKVVDFGIAKASDSSSRTRIGVVKGKLSYMSPEQATGAAVDRRADVFAAGVMLWEIASGRRMWKDVEDVGIMYRLSSGDIPRLEDALATPDPEIEAICARALAPDPRERYATAAELRADLERHLARLAHRPTAHDVGVLLGELFEPERRRMRALIDDQIRRMRASVDVPLPVFDVASDVSAAPSRPNEREHATVGDAQRRDSWDMAHGVRHLSLPPGATEMSLTGAHTASRLVARRSRRTLWIALAASAGASAATVALFGVRRRAIEPSVAAVVAPSAEAMPSSAPPPPRTVRIAVSAQPPSATVALDGAPMRANPLVVAADGTMHELMVEAPGYAAHSELVAFDADRAIAVALEKKPAAAAPTTPRTPSRPARLPTKPGDVDLGF